MLYFFDLFRTSTYFFWRVDIFFNYITFWFCSDVITFSFIFVLKLTFVWFFVVWLRLNMLRLRFDQVASYTWHELIVYVIFLLIHAILLSLLL